MPDDARPAAAAPPLTPKVMGPIEKLAAKMWPGVPVVPLLQPGATDGQFLTPAGIPTYGVSGIFGDPDGGGVHGLNERMPVQVRSTTAATSSTELVKIYADQK